MSNKIIKVISILALFAMCSANAFAQKQDKSFLRMDLRESVSDAVPNQFSMKIENNSTKPNEKNPFLGALFSGVIPGAGEFYAESYIKAAVFFAVEVGLWTTYAIYENKGDDQTEAFQKYADQNWSINKYAQWLVEQQFTGFAVITDPNNPDREQLRLQVNEVERQNFSHQLPPFGEQQYYELIGKYQNFVAGWADANISVLSKNPGSPNYYGTYKTEMYVDYAADRQQANDYYDMASTSTTLVIVNHLLSAADAAWSVSMFNKDLRMKSSLRLQPKLGSDYRKVIVPMAHLSINF